MSLRFAMKRVLVTRSDLLPESYQLLKESFEVKVSPHDQPMERPELLKDVAGMDGVILFPTDRVDAEFLDAAGPQLKVISTVSVGTDHIDHSECAKRGLSVGHTPDVLTDAVAELTLGLTIATGRKFLESQEKLRNGEWFRAKCKPFWIKGKELRGSVVGIFGMGRIGHGVLKRLLGFGCKKLIYTSRQEKPEADAMGAEKVPFIRLLSESDYLICLSALTDVTKGVFNRRAFQQMKPDAVFINVSRGGTVVQEDLLAALDNGEIGAAGLDVMTPEPLPLDHPLMTHKKCTLIPHIGSDTVVTRRDMVMLAVNNLIAGLKGEPMPAALPL